MSLTEHKQEVSHARLVAPDFAAASSPPPGARLHSVWRNGTWPVARTRRRFGFDVEPTPTMPTAYITHPSCLLHEMGPYHPGMPGAADGHRRPHDRRGHRPATRATTRRRRHARADRARAQRALHRRDRGGEPGRGPALHRPRHRAQPAFARRRAARGRRGGAGARSRHARRGVDRVLRGASARPSRRARPRHGLLPLQQRRRRRRARARGPRARRAWRSSTSTCITATAPRTSSRATRAC